MPPRVWALLAPPPATPPASLPPRLSCSSYARLSPSSTRTECAALTFLNFASASARLDASTLSAVRRREAWGRATRITCGGKGLTLTRELGPRVVSGQAEWCHCAGAMVGRTVKSLCQLIIRSLDLSSLRALRHTKQLVICLASAQCEDEGESTRDAQHPVLVRPGRPTPENSVALPDAGHPVTC